MRSVSKYIQNLQWSLVLFILVSPAVAQTLPLEQELDNFLQTEDFQGVALISQGEALLYHKGFGLANREHGIPNTQSSVFRIASVTKQLTAVAILHLQDQGLLDVSEDIGKFLPDFPNGEKITIHHLLAHTSGIPEIHKLDNFMNIKSVSSFYEKLIEHIETSQDSFDITDGEFHYSNSGYIILGMIIEKVSGMTYETYIRENLLNPLEMSKTAYDHSQNIVSGRASGYVFKDGAYYNSKSIDMSLPFAAGGYLSTAQDLFFWNLALHEGKVLSKKSYESLTSVHSRNPYKGIAYGYGLFIGSSNPGFTDLGTPVYGHFGNINGFRSACIYYPKSRITIILLTNLQTTNLHTIHIQAARLLKESQLMQ